MYKDLIKIFDESARNEEVCVLVVTGSGDFYSSGNDFVSYLTDPSINPESETATLQFVMFS